MVEIVRTLIVVLVLSVPAFYFGERFSRAIEMRHEFVFFRNAWLAVTIGAYLSGSFLAFAAVLLAFCIYAYAVRAADVSIFFLLLLAAPLVNVEIGGFGLINRFIDINQGRLLVIFLLLPALLAARKHRGKFSAPDYLIVVYVLLRVVLDSREAEVTHALRMATLHTLDTLIPYFAFSRAVTSAADVRKVFLGFIVAVLPLGLVDVFEMLKGWRLYSIVAGQWGEPGLGYLHRDGMLRGSGIAESPIISGYVIMVALGCLLALWRPKLPRQNVGAVMAIFGAGLIATLSRGPWVGAGLLVVVYLATGPQAATKLGKLAIGACVALVVLPLTPIGEKLINYLPFIGTIEAGSVEYRQNELMDASLAVIERNLWFGSVDYLLTPEMRSLAELVGLIDIVNHYLGITLDSGLVGLSLFLGFFGSILLSLLGALKRRVTVADDTRIYVRAMIAILIGILVTIATVSAIEFTAYIFWAFAGLGVALVRIAYRERSVAARAVRVHQVPV